MLVQRTVSQRESAESREFTPENLKLADFRSEQGYILLGEPGAGKTTSFEEEARESGGEFVKRQAVDPR